MLKDNDKMSTKNNFKFFVVNISISPTEIYIIKENIEMGSILNARQSEYILK